MKRALFASAAMALSVTASAASLDEVLTCNFETMGGLENIKAVESARMTGTMSMGPMQAPFTIEFQKPNSVRMEFEIQGMTAVQAYDGENGWAIMPFMGKTTPEAMVEDELKSIQEMAEWEGPFIDWEEKGHSVELVGVEDIEGTEAHVIKVVRAGSEDETTYYLDTEYCLTFLTKGVQDIQGNKMAMSQSIGDYKEVGDIVMAHSMIGTIGDGPGAMQQALTVESVELNVDDITEARFAMPATEEMPEEAN
ncbi:MAG: hypothetical protein AAFV47_07480 [Pseudomonadota bacterium]